MVMSGTLINTWREALAAGELGFEAAVWYRISAYAQTGTEQLSVEWAAYPISAVRIFPVTVPKLWSK